MKNFIFAFLLVACWVSLASEASATWTCAQGATGCTVTTTRTCTMSAVTSCNITVTSTHAHAVEVLMLAATATTPTISSTSDGGFTRSTLSHGTDATAGSVDIAYNLNSTGGATTITCTQSVAVASTCNYFEFTGTGAGFTFDTGATVDHNVACTTCAGVVMTLATTRNYILIQTLVDAATASAINQSYTGVFSSGDGFAFKINVSVVGTTPNWTSTSARSAGGGIAIYEQIPCNSLLLLGAGCK